MHKTGWLLYGSSDAEHNRWFIDKLISECSLLGLELTLVYTDFPSEMPAGDPDIIINRSRNCTVAYEFEKRGVRLVNPAVVTEIGNDKELSYELAERLGIPYMPYITVKHPVYEDLRDKAAGFGYPFVLKPSDGHGGKDVCLIRDEGQLEASFREICSGSGRCPYDKLILQRCASVMGRDLRIYMMDNRIIAGMLRIAGNDSDLRANYSLGGKAMVHPLTERERLLAERISDALPSDFIGIDLIYHNGEPVFNEIEDAVGSRMLYEKTDLDAVRMFGEHICSLLS